MCWRRKSHQGIRHSNANDLYRTSAKAISFYSVWITLRCDTWATTWALSQFQCHLWKCCNRKKNVDNIFDLDHDSWNSNMKIWWCINLIGTIQIYQQFVENKNNILIKKRWMHAYQHLLNHIHSVFLTAMKFNQRPFGPGEDAQFTIPLIAIDAMRCATFMPWHIRHYVCCVFVHVCVGVEKALPIAESRLGKGNIGETAALLCLPCEFTSDQRLQQTHCHIEINLNQILRRDNRLMCSKMKRKSNDNRNALIRYAVRIVRHCLFVIAWTWNLGQMQLNPEIITSHLVIQLLISSETSKWHYSPTPYLLLAGIHILALWLDVFLYDKCIGLNCYIGKDKK